ncbi:hypothetical protein CTI12_AA010080 [Artemisia annua]|uniref:Uncharacterized protein n=1 Tax=Artemisia annua TaxID=35608 RepID=A0A2U1QMP4_ARTAN|nr:hypothetical protein CTI12_AA010080 [Artemisia annua]
MAMGNKLVRPARIGQSSSAYNTVRHSFLVLGYLQYWQPVNLLLLAPTNDVMIRQRTSTLAIVISDVIIAGLYSGGKFTTDSKLEEAHALSTSNERKLLEVEVKLRTVDAKLAEVNRKTSDIIRKSSGRGEVTFVDCSTKGKITQNSVFLLLLFIPDEGTSMGLVQHEGGPCVVLAAIQSSHYTLLSATAATANSIFVKKLRTKYKLWLVLAFRDFSVTIRRFKIPNEENKCGTYMDDIVKTLDHGMLSEIKLLRYDIRNIDGGMFENSRSRLWAHSVIVVSNLGTISLKHLIEREIIDGGLSSHKKLHHKGTHDRENNITQLLETSKTPSLVMHCQTKSASINKTMFESDTPYGRYENKVSNIIRQPTVMHRQTEYASSNKTMFESDTPCGTFENKVSNIIRQSTWNLKGYLTLDTS